MFVDAKMIGENCVTAIYSDESHRYDPDDVARYLRKWDHKHSREGYCARISVVMCNIEFSNSDDAVLFLLEHS